MINQHNPRSGQDPLYGWLMVFIVFSLSSLSFGALGSISVFLKPLAAEFGWTRGQTSFGYSAIAFSSAIFGIFWGFLADRFGTRWFGLIGAIVMVMALYFLSGQSSLLHFYGFYFLIGAFGNAIIATPLFANVGFWFSHRPGLALGITAAGGAFGQGVVPYFVGSMIEAEGWRSAYTSMAVFYGIIAIPLSLMIRESPLRERARVSPTPVPSGFVLSEKEVVIWISIAVLFCCNCMSVPIVHLVPLLTDSGHSLETATQVLMVLMLAGVAGRIFGGKLGDSIGALPAYFFMSLGQTVFVFWFPHILPLTGLYALAVVFGFTYSGVMSSILVCTRTMVSPGFAARAMSITSFFGWSGMALGGLIGGIFYDFTGNYFGSYSFASIAGIINLLVLMLFWRRTSRATKMVTHPI